MITDNARFPVFQASRRVDFSANPLADLSFDFYDSALLDEVTAGKADSVEFFRLLALCHTVMPEEEDGKLVYQGGGRYGESSFVFLAHFTETCDI